MRLVAAAGIVLGSAAAAVIAPVWTYAISLLLFGLPHVLVELRYIDQRFRARLPRRMLVGFGICLGGIVLVRALGLANVGSGHDRITVELLLGACLIAVALPMIRNRRASPWALATGVALLLGVVYAPITTIVALALLHNLTPVGFLAERLQGNDRRFAMGICALVFAVVPGILLCTPPTGMNLLGPLTTGHLDSHLPTFVPPALLGTSFADRLFATAAYLQCMHYAVVLHVLPRLSGGTETASVMMPWPSPRVFRTVVASVGLLAAIGFAANFGDTRSVYSLFAAVHAWIEIPVLLIACAVLPTRTRSEAIAA